MRISPYHCLFMDFMHIQKILPERQPLYIDLIVLILARMKILRYMAI